MTEEKPSIAQLDEVWLRERLEYEEQPDNAVPSPVAPLKWDEAIQQCRDELEEAAKALRASKKAAANAARPDSRKRAHSDDEGWAWRSVKDRGQRLWDSHEAMCFRVSLGTYKRALSIVNALALAAPARGFTIREDEKLGRIVFFGHDAEVHLRVTELLDRKTRPRTRYDGKVEQEKYLVPTGRLRIVLQIDYRGGATFEDRNSRPLESQLNRVFCGIYRQVVKAWRAERKRLALRRELDVEIRQRAEDARFRAERRRAVAEERRRRRRLALEANRWTQARRIRNYIAHIGARARERNDASGEFSEWVAWALRVAAAMDPTEARLVPTKPDSTDPSAE